MRLSTNEKQVSRLRKLLKTITFPELRVNLMESLKSSSVVSFYKDFISEYNIEILDPCPNSVTGLNGE